MNNSRFRVAFSQAPQYFWQGRRRNSLTIQQKVRRIFREFLSGDYYDLFAGKPMRKPEGFRTSDRVVGFTLGYSF